MNARSRFVAKYLLPLLTLSSVFGLRAVAAPTDAFPQPDPSSQEQYLLELINAARANPAAEGQMLASVTDPEILRYYSYYSVKTSQIVSDFNGYAAKPPLAFNADLMVSSRQQSLYQAPPGSRATPVPTGPPSTNASARPATYGADWARTSTPIRKPLSSATSA